MKKKAFLTAAALILALCCAIGGTLAWLVAKTDSVKNTFTVGDINIALAESENLDLKMIPGNTITKDPKVTVTAGSEACWLFVKIEESENFRKFLSYDVADGWTQLENNPGVYYREVSAAAHDQTFSVLKDNQVKVLEDVTKQQLTALTEQTFPTLTFTAYAVQKDNIATAAMAWEKITP